MTPDQHRVLRGILPGALVTLGAFLLPLFGARMPRIPDDPATLFRLWALLSASVVFWLTVCIGRLAQHRFLAPQDIHAGASDTGTERARVLQSILQNTLEQAVLASVAYGAWIAISPDRWRAMPVICAMLFAAGRVLFFRGYEQGAGARAFGFALTFYPSTILLLGVVAMQFVRLVSGA